MIFEFLIFYQEKIGIGTDICTTLFGLLSQTIDDLEIYFDDFNSDEAKQMLISRHKRLGDETVDQDGNTLRNTIFGFALELPEDTDEAQALVEKFSQALAETDLISHVVKFEDPLLCKNLIQWSKEIFSLEMKLRRILTLIYLNAYQGDFYNLLREESVKFMSPPTVEEMQNTKENHFFYLTFSQYVQLNNRPDPKLCDLLSNIRNSESYNSLYAELNRKPVENQNDAVLLLNIKDKMGAIEKMRNCVAHNRQPSRRTIGSYDLAYQEVNNLLNEYLDQWNWQEAIETEEEASSLKQ